MSRTVRFGVTWYSGDSKQIDVPLADYGMVLADSRTLGSSGLSPEAADLIDLGAAVAWMERLLPRRRQAPIGFSLTFPARAPERWTEQTTDALSELLSFAGDAQWSVEVVKRSSHRTVPAHRTTGGSIDQVMLFSGGLDSTCGIAMNDRAGTRLVSFYTRQKTKQSDTAETLDHHPPVQWRLERTPGRRPGRSFRYRGTFFLCMAAATSSSWDCSRIIQSENGVLATAVPPSPAWLMTKHAHPRLHLLASGFFSALFGATYEVVNPFRTLTKRQCVENAQAANDKLTDAVLKQTDSCWHLWTNLLPGANHDTYPGRKKPGRHCGVCIPCLVRRTALQDREYERNMSVPKWQNDERFGRDFRAYHGFLQQVRAASLEDFYFVLPAPGRRLYANDLFVPDDLYDLFRTFADEFWEVFVE